MLRSNIKEKNFKKQPKLDIEVPQKERKQPQLDPKPT